MRVASIVEGDGDVESVPVLLRRIAGMLREDLVLDLPKPSRSACLVTACSRSASSSGLWSSRPGRRDPAAASSSCSMPTRTARRSWGLRYSLARERRGATGGSMWSWPRRSTRPGSSRPPPPFAGHRGIREDLQAPRAPEEIRGAKEWLSRNMTAGRSYRETLDQPALTAVFDLRSARQAPSFDKLWREVDVLLS